MRLAYSQVSPIGLGICTDYPNIKYKRMLRKVAAGGLWEKFRNITYSFRNNKLRAEHDVSKLIMGNGQGNNVTPGVSRQAAQQTSVAPVTARGSQQPPPPPAPVPGTRAVPKTQPRPATPATSTATVKNNTPAVKPPQGGSSTTAVPGNNTQTNSNPNSNPNSTQGYGIWNRLRDIWYMLLDGVKLGWYSSRIKSGMLTPEQWTSVQAAAKRLGNNKTALAVGKFINPNLYGQSFFSGLHGFMQQAPNLHKLRALVGEVKSDFAYGLPLVNQMRAWQKDGTLDKMKTQVHWAYKHKLLPEKDYSEFNKGLEAYNAMSRKKGFNYMMGMASNASKVLEALTVGKN